MATVVITLEIEGADDAADVAQNGGNHRRHRRTCAACQAALVARKALSPAEREDVTRAKEVPDKKT